MAAINWFIHILYYNKYENSFTDKCDMVLLVKKTCKGIMR